MDNITSQGNMKENRKDIFSSKNLRTLNLSKHKIDNLKPPLPDRELKRTATISFSKKSRLSETNVNQKRISNHLPKFNFENEHSKQFSINRIVITQNQITQAMSGIIIHKKIKTFLFFSQE